MPRKSYAVGVVILGWVVANLLGVAAIGAATFVLPLLKSIPGMLVSSLVIGLPIGFAQWVALRRVAPISILWVLTISAGLLLALKVSPVFAGVWGFLDDESVLSLTAGYTTVGLLVGLVQWLFLRGHLARSLVWLLGSAAGLGLGTGLVFASNLVNESGILAIILTAVVYALVTGWVLWWLAGSRRNPESHLVNAA